VPAALEFRGHVCGGEQNLMRYLKQSMSEGGDRVAEILRTHVMQADDDCDEAEGGPRLRDCAFANVRLPIAIGVRVSVSVVDEEGEKNPSSLSSPCHISPEEMGRVVDYMQATFVHEFATFIAVYGYGGALWARLSGQVYLDLADWEWCGNVLAEVCARVREGVFREDGVVEGKGMRTEELDGNGDFSGLKDVAERFKEFGIETE
jgi:hercynylcysteine S-oxide lyase